MSDNRSARPAAFPAISLRSHGRCTSRAVHESARLTCCIAYSFALCSVAAVQSSAPAGVGSAVTTNLRSPNVSQCTNATELVRTAELAWTLVRQACVRRTNSSQHSSCLALCHLEIAAAAFSCTQLNSGLHRTRSANGTLALQRMTSPATAEPERLPNQPRRDLNGFSDRCGTYSEHWTTAGQIRDRLPFSAKLRHLCVASQFQKAGTGAGV